jgi:hypothetical protein
LGPDVPIVFFKMSSTDLLALANTSVWLVVSHQELLQRY